MRVSKSVGGFKVSMEELKGETGISSLMVTYHNQYVYSSTVVLRDYWGERAFRFFDEFALILISAVERILEKFTRQAVFDSQFRLIASEIDMRLYGERID